MFRYDAGRCTEHIVKVRGLVYKNSQRQAWGYTEVREARAEGL
jgi:hypothetical protein